MLVITNLYYNILYNANHLDVDARIHLPLFTTNLILIYIINNLVLIYKIQKNLGNMNYCT